MPTVYPSLRIGAKRRLEIFRKEATTGNYPTNDWRRMRFATLKSDNELNAGKHDDKPMWYIYGRPFFERERDAHDMEGVSMNHTGWFTDNDQSAKLVAIVARLPHGRFISGYRNTENDERIYFAEVFNDASDAATNGDYHAEKAADEEREYDHRWNEARKIREEIEEYETDAARLFALRNHATLGDSARDSLASVIETLREKRDELKNDYSDIEF